VSEKKLPSWQANNFSDLNFFLWSFVLEISANFQKWRENCGSVDRLSAWKFFGFFLTEFVRQKKYERSWESSAWELREFSGRKSKIFRKK
jgi:hypothetical protein